MNFYELSQAYNQQVFNKRLEVDKTWQNKRASMIAKGYSHARITWYYEYAIRRMTAHIFNSMKQDLFSAIDEEISRVLPKKIQGVYEEFVNVRSIGFGNTVPFSKV